MVFLQYLLQNGADPRLYASDGQTPENVSSDSGFCMSETQFGVFTIYFYKNVAYLRNFHFMAESC